MQPYDDLRSFVSDLEAAGEVVKVDAELAPEFEIPAALRYLDRRDDRTILFRRVKGYTVPVVGNVFQNYRNIAMALGLQDSRAVLAEYRKRSKELIKPEVRQSGPVKEIIVRQDIDILREMPVLTHHEKDAGPYFSSAVTIARDPQTGIRGIGIHRIQVQGKNKIGIYLGSPPLSRFLSSAEAMGKSLEIAVVIGLDPLSFLSSITFAPE